MDRRPELLRETARPPSGDRRSAFFTARPGRVPALREALEAHAPPGSRLLEMERAIAGGLFGPRPYHPEIAERLGDLLLLPPSPGTVSYRAPGMPPPTRFLFGAHGGLEPGELLVPLVSAPLAAFAVDRPVPLTKR